MRFRLAVEPARGNSHAARATALLLPPVATLLLGSLIFWLCGIAPLAGLHAFFIAPVSSVYGICELFVKASPLALIALGLMFAFRSNTWNIGAEGQFILGAICAGGVALDARAQSLPAALLLPLMLAAGAAGGAAWAGVVAFLKTRFAANEILSSLMLVYIAQLLLLWLVQGPWRDPHGFNFPETALFVDHANLPRLVAGTRLHAGVLLAVPLALAALLVLRRTLYGFQVRVVGAAPRAASFAGFSRNRIVWSVLLTSGALAGIAGMLETSGLVGQLVGRISPGYGFTAIIVAFLGRLHPFGILAASLIVALTYLGGEAAQISLGLPFAAAEVFQGILLFAVLASRFALSRRIVLHRSPRAGTTLESEAPATQEAEARP